MRTARLGTVRRAVRGSSREIGRAVKSKLPFGDDGIRVHRWSIRHTRLRGLLPHPYFHYDGAVAGHPAMIEVGIVIYGDTSDSLFEAYIEFALSPRADDIMDFILPDRRSATQKGWLQRRRRDATP